MVLLIVKVSKCDSNTKRKVMNIVAPLVFAGAVNMTALIAFDFDS